MFHLSAGYMLCVVLCTQVLSRCLIFRQYPVKMSHLSAGCMLYVVLCTRVLSIFSCCFVIFQVLHWNDPSMCMFTLYDRGVRSSSLYELYIDNMKVVGDCLMTADMGEEIVSKDQSTMPGEKSWEKGNKVYTSWLHSVVYVCASSQLYNSSIWRLKRKREDGVIWIGGSWLTKVVEVKAVCTNILYHGVVLKVNVIYCLLTCKLHPSW